MTSLQIVRTGEERDANPSAASPGGSPLNTRGIIAIGLLACFGMLGSFAAWAMLAPLKSAVVTEGFVKVPGYRKKVQHLEGGIVEKILVEEGQTIAAGQLLISLESKNSTFYRALLHGELMSNLLLDARLLAEERAAPEITIPAEVMRHASDPAVQRIVATQGAILKSRRVAYDGSLLLKDQRIRQYEQQIVGIDAQMGAQTRQIELINELVADQDKLWLNNLTRKSQMLTLKIQQAQIESENGKSIAERARMGAAISEVDEDKLQTRRKLLDDIAQERKTVQDNIFGLRQKLLSVQDTLDRLDIRAPIGGTVVGLAVNTERSVVAPRETLLEIVPSTVKLTIEANVRPEDIDAVHPGMTAQVQLATAAARRSNRIKGRVVRVSADRLLDSRNGSPYFRAEVELDPADPQLRHMAQLTPGMPVDVFVETGARSFARYLLAPILQSVSRGALEH